MPTLQPKQQPQGLLDKLDQLYFQLRKVLFDSWAFAKVIQEEPFPVSADVPICYVLEDSSDLEFMLLDNVCVERGLPRPRHPRFKSDAPAYFIALDFHSRNHTFKHPTKNRNVNQLLHIQQTLEEDSSSDALIVPVVICWDRLPRKEKKFWQLFFLSTFRPTSNFGRLLAILFGRRHISLQYSKHVSFRHIIDERLGSKKVARKIHRLLRIHFRQQRQLIQGPDVSHKRTLVHQVMSAPTVHQVIEKIATEQNKKVAIVEREARGHILEIASDTSYLTLRLLDYFLDWVWNKIYNGIKVHGIERIKEVAQDHEIVYLPCHRSYMDFLLLSYLLFYNNLRLPHIASGINLNMPVVGSILRKSGAFFMRRSFGNILYTAIFQEYLHLMLTKGHSIEFFIEGSRSRTGRLLAPKRGMLAMMCKSYLRDSSRPIAIAPVYFGYEKVLEEKAYSQELKGTKKKKETLRGLARARSSLSINYGDVHVNFAPPIKLTDFLAKTAPDWQKSSEQAITWVTPASQELSILVSESINQAVTILTTNLIACCLLIHGEKAVTEQTLKRRLELLIHMLQRVPISHFMVLDNKNSDDIIAKTEALGVLEREKRPEGDFLAYSKSALPCISWYRNNIIHSLILPAIVSTLWRKMPAPADQEAVSEYCRLLYPHIKKTYHLPWSEGELPSVLDKCYAALEEVGILESDETGYRRLCDTSAKEDQEDSGKTLAYIASTVLDRYGIIANVFKQSFDQEIDVATLTLHSQNLAESMAKLPMYHRELSDKDLMKDCIKQLTNSGEIAVTASDHIDTGGTKSGLAFADWFINMDAIKKS